MEGVGVKEVGSTGAVNCMACRVRVAVGDQRAHYRSEWHRVNLKRRVAGMAPISLREFEVRLTNMQNMAMEEEKQRVKGERKGFMCETCSKRFSSEKALVQHENSRRHMDKVQELHGVEGDGNEILEEEEDYESRLENAVALEANECLFCREKFSDVEENVKHMAKGHSFFVPYLESLRDINALCSYLGEKVGVGHACVFCSKSFTSLESVRKHMIDKSHCKMTEDDDDWFAEYGEFYRWDDGATDDGEDAGEWEELEGAEREEALIAETSGGLVNRQSRTTRRELTTDNDDSAFELVLSSGHKVGHRSMQRYYRQNPRPIETRESVLLSRLMSEYRLLGNSGFKANQVELPSKQELESKRRVEQHIAKRQYYIAKTRTNTGITVLNSGYRP